MQTQTETRRLVDVPAAIETPLGKKLFSLVGTPLCIDYQLDPADVDRLPTSGPVIVVANHPFGAVEGLVLADILTKRRQDVRIMANALLGKIPEMQPWLLTADSIQGKNGALDHLPSLESGQRWLQNGGVLLTFPAESVSHLHFRSRTVVDPPWSQKVATLARRTNATVVPVFFEGRNSALFQIAGFVHPRLRTALLPKELLRSSQTTISLRIGKPIRPEKTLRFAEDKELTEYLRFKTYALANRESVVRPRFRRKPAATVAPAEIAPAIPAEVLKNEVARLPTDAKLLEQGPYVVYLARQPQIPAVMREIGHLREKTFRAVGEGTGQALDLDDFDKHYLHLFMWNKDTNEVIGSYRLGVADQILDSHGMAGLYTSTLFKFKPGFLDHLNPAVELGRSFIRAEYQRKPLSLALLWRGIGEFLVRNPQYKTLFGPVSISGDYGSTSRRLMVQFLGQTCAGDERLLSMVKAKNPPRDRVDLDELAMLKFVAADVEDLSTLIADIESDDKGLPVLIKHYLKLNARLYGFNVDPAFGNCLDGLIVVDLRTTNPKVLKRFMGEAGHSFYNSVA